MQNYPTPRAPDKCGRCPHFRGSSPNGGFGVWWFSRQFPPLLVTPAVLRTASGPYLHSTGHTQPCTSTSDKPLARSLGKSPLLPAPAPTWRAIADIKRQRGTLSVSRIGLPCGMFAQSGSLFISVEFFKTLFPEISCLGFTLSHEQKCF